MRHQKRGRKLNRTASHRKALMRSLASALIEHKRIRTTDAKAKEARRFVERLVTFAKRGDLHARRLVLKALPGIRGKHLTQILFEEIAPHYTERAGGYTRITKLGRRSNDKAPVSLLEFVDLSSPSIAKEQSDATAKKKS